MGSRVPTVPEPASPELRQERSAVLGELALRLEPRALLAGRLPAVQRQGPARVAFADQALPARDRARLERLAGVSLVPERGGRPAELRAEDGSLLARLGALARAEGLLGLLALCETWRHATAPAPPPRVMGVVNVTPDSFSDGGRFLDPRRAIEHGLELEAQGADLLDVGGESTRPGSEGVPAEVELARVLPVVEGLAARARVPLSIDTTKSVVARAALEAGATLVNDVSAGTLDPATFGLVAERGAGIVLMHMRGRPRDMQQAPRYADVVREVLAFLRERAARCAEAGVALSRITVDPGIGFGKRLEDNLALVRAIPELRGLGLPVLLGVSRKSFLGRITGSERPAQRLGETAAAVASCALLGADVLRVHDVELMAPAVRVARALGGAEPAGPAEA